MIDLDIIVDHLAEGLQVVDREYRYLYVNPVAAEHGQSTPDALVGHTMPEVYPGIEESEMFAKLRRVIEEGVSIQMENEFSYPDGTTRWFDLRMAPVPEGAVILSIDVSKTKDLSRQVTRAQRMEAIGQLAGGFAHDFNNLLTIIHACGSFLIEGLEESDPRREDAVQIVDAARRGAELTGKMLSFARRKPVEPRLVSIGEALDAVDQLLRRTLGADITLTVGAHPSLGPVRIDPSALDQVLLNLALNARDAMPDGGSITIEAEPTLLRERMPLRQGVGLDSGPYVVISVTDTGSGIEPEVVDRVFEPFFTTKAESHGTGLGLATSWGLVRQAGGVITVYSELEAGTTFRIYLPEVRDADARADEGRPIEPEPVELTGQRVLVVEDRDAIRELVTRVLRGAECRVLEARSAAEALLLLEDVGGTLDLMITDVVMPRISGFELASRASARFPVLPILLISGYAPAALSGREGASLDLPLLSKPFTPEQLLEAVRSTLGRK